MFLERLQNNNNVYRFKLNKFLKAQFLIADKYMDKLEKYNDIDIMDKYILHIMEEIWEVKHSEDELEFCEELSDVLMYLGSLYGILCKRSNIDIGEESDFYITSNNRFEFSVSDLIDEIISIRRFYPGRKWHKNEEIQINSNAIDLISINLLKNMISNFVGILIKKQDFNFNKYVGYKQQLLSKGHTLETNNRTLKTNTVYKHFKNKLYVVISATIPIDSLPDYAYDNHAFSSTFTETDNNIIKIFNIDGILYHLKDDYDKPLVIYKSLYSDIVSSYARDLDMFLSPVDKIKYPDVKSTYRFEVLK